MNESTVYMPPEAKFADGRALVFNKDAPAWLYEQGAPMGTHWFSPGILPDGGRIWLRCDDEGCGSPAHVRERAEQPA